MRGAYNDLVEVRHDFGALNKQVQSAQETADKALSGVNELRMEVADMKEGQAETNAEMGGLKNDMVSLRNRVLSSERRAYVKILLRVMAFLIMFLVSAWIGVYFYRLLPTHENEATRIALPQHGFPTTPPSG